MNDPAFPFVLADSVEGQRYERGMTLRDYFAAKAMQGGVAGLVTGATLLNLDASEIAQTAYRIANAMLKAREA